MYALLKDCGVFCGLYWISEALSSKHVSYPFFHTFHQGMHLAKDVNAEVLRSQLPTLLPGMSTASVCILLVLKRGYDSGNHVLLPLFPVKLIPFCAYSSSLQHG